MKTLYLIRGLPGSGKSTYAQSLAVKYVEADMFHVNNGVYRFKRENVKNAHEWCRGVVNTFLREGFSVAVSNTFTRLHEMQPYFDLAADHKAIVKVVQMRGEYPNIHAVPQSVLDDMRNRWEWFPEGEFKPLPTTGPTSLNPMPVNDREESVT